MMTFNEFIQKYKLENKTRSFIKKNSSFSCLSLSDVGVFLRDSAFLSDTGIVYLHPTKAFHWVVYINKNYFDIYDCAPPQNNLIL